MRMNIYNSEGYLDPTAYEALSNIERERKKIKQPIQKSTTGGSENEREYSKKMLRL